MASKAFLKGSSEDIVNLNELTPEKAEVVKFIRFTPVPSDGNSEALNKWMESTWYIEDDLHHLLSKPAQQLVFFKSHFLFVILVTYMFDKKKIVMNQRLFIWIPMYYKLLLFINGKGT